MAISPHEPLTIFTNDRIKVNAHLFFTELDPSPTDIGVYYDLTDLQATDDDNFHFLPVTDQRGCPSGTDQFNAVTAVGRIRLDSLGATDNIHQLIDLASQDAHAASLRCRQVDALLDKAVTNRTPANTADDVITALFWTLSMDPSAGSDHPTNTPA